MRGDLVDEGEDQEEFLESLTPQEREELLAMQQTPHIFSRLVSSIAPTVFGESHLEFGLVPVE